MATRLSSARGAGVFSEQMIYDFARDWHEHGPGVLVAVRKENPVAYLTVAAKLVPKELLLQLARPVAEMADDELQAAALQGAAGGNDADRAHQRPIVAEALLERARREVLGEDDDKDGDFRNSRCSQEHHSKEGEIGWCVVGVALDLIGQKFARLELSRLLGGAMAGVGGVVDAFAMRLLKSRSPAIFVQEPSAAAGVLREKYWSSARVAEDARNVIVKRNISQEMRELSQSALYDTRHVPQPDLRGSHDGTLLLPEQKERIVSEIWWSWHRYRFKSFKEFYAKSPLRTTTTLRSEKAAAQLERYLTVQVSEISSASTA